MTIQTPIIADTTQEIIDALTRRSSALMRTRIDLSGSFNLLFRANRGDHDAKLAVLSAIFDSIERLDAADEDLSHRLRAQLDADEVDWIEHSSIAADARERSYKVDIKIDDIRMRQSAEQRRKVAQAHVARKKARRSAFTKAYEAAEKLSSHQRRMLAGAILDI